MPFEERGRLGWTAGPPRLRTIATEGAFTIPEVAEAVREVVRAGGANLDLKLLSLVEDASSPPPGAPAPDPSLRDAVARLLLPRLLDAGAGRLAEMDAHGVDMHVLSLGVLGVQMFEADRAVALARLCGGTPRASRAWPPSHPRIPPPP